MPNLTIDILDIITKCLKRHFEFDWSHLVRLIIVIKKYILL